MAVFQTKALILRHTTDREHDRMLVVLTPDRGKLQVRARGTKKSVSKLGGSLEPLMVVDLNVADGRVTGQVVGSVIVERFPLLRGDHASLVMAQWWLELVERLTKPESHDPKIYDLSVNTLQQMATEINESIGRRWMNLLRAALGLLAHEGYVHWPDTCAICQRNLVADDWAYDSGRGFIHRSEAQPQAMRLSAQLFQWLIDNDQQIETRQIFPEFHRCLEAIIHQTLDRPLNSERVLRQVVRAKQVAHPV